MKRLTALIAALVLIHTFQMTVSADSSVLNCNYTTMFLEPGDSGPDVVRLQQALINLGYMGGPADGRYGRETTHAVEDFQMQNGIHGTAGYEGIATKFTQALLYSYNARNDYEDSKRYAFSSGKHSIYNPRFFRKYGNTCSLTFEVQNMDAFEIDSIRFVYWLEDNNRYPITLQGYDYWDVYWENLNMYCMNTQSFSIDLTPYAYELSNTYYIRFCVAEIAYTTGEIYINFDASIDANANISYEIPLY